MYICVYIFSNLCLSSRNPHKCTIYIHIYVLYNMLCTNANSRNICSHIMQSKVTKEKRNFRAYIEQHNIPALYCSSPHTLDTPPQNSSLLPNTKNNIYVCLRRCTFVYPSEQPLALSILCSCSLFIL